MHKHGRPHFWLTQLIIPTYLCSNSFFIHTIKLQQERPIRRVCNQRNETTGVNIKRIYEIGCCFEHLLSMVSWFHREKKWQNRLTDCDSPICPCNRMSCNILKANFFANIYDKIPICKKKKSNRKRKWSGMKINWI